MFKWDYDMNTNNWSSYVNSLFDLCNLDNFENQTTCLKELCYEKLCDIENINWYQKLNFKPKLRTYKLLKNNKITERYVKFNLDCKERSMLAQLRMGTLALHVETGRYRNVPLNRRFCFHCLDQIEDETHFVFDCTLYTEYRLELFNYFHMYTIWVEIYQTYHAMINYNCFFMNFQDNLPNISVNRLRKENTCYMI